MKHAFVTGVGRRLGFAICQRLLDQGWQVSGHYRTPSDATTTLAGRGATLYQADLEDADAVIAMVTTLQSSARLDLIVHNASCFTPEPDDLAAKARWSDACHRVHVQAPMLINEGLGALLQASDGDPNVVHITDIFAERPDPQYRTYTAAKAGLDNLALSYAKHWAPKVRVNRIQPGPILFLPEHSEAHKKRVLANTLLQREGGLDPVLDAIWLLIDNAYLTGAVIKVDGGRFLAQ
ncbi:SDR family oxidoreductase [Litorivicinus lipolyticus]|uniref:SDR family oxidoreductase n=1 Tax=Litorivicinus lipolyticus TaxID=418701 RepID=A0A5Q2Q9W3_9GAMM|nr:SDR family oxidoreductase [Litorivicinus lipolyticus]QGG79754.1 SDR family oxidoreductase [Litorivicinus lipolyticus]